MLDGGTGGLKCALRLCTKVQRRSVYNVRCINRHGCVGTVPPSKLRDGIMEGANRLVDLRWADCWCLESERLADGNIF